MKPRWEYRERLGIHRHMAKVIELTIEATKQQLKHERKKLKKLKYGI